MDPRFAVALLYLLAFVLPVIGVLRAYHGARRAIALVESRAERFVALRSEWIDAEKNEPRDPTETYSDRRSAITSEYHEAFRAEGFPIPSRDNTGTEGVHAATDAVRAIFQGNGGNATIAALGLVAGFVASIWSLMLACE